jgi:uncharacterized protein (DUF342 family)
MPDMTEVLKSAKVLAKGVCDMVEKKAQTKETLRKQAEVVVDTLMARGLVPSQDKSAAVDRLMDHENTLSALNRTAQQVEAASLGAPEKKASEKRDVRESDSTLLQRLGF